jgi:hypothetical protein
MGNVTQAVVRTPVVASAPPRRGLTDEDRRRIRQEDRTEARRQLGSLVRFSRDRRIRTGC